jgi:hypothetical protein
MGGHGVPAAVPRAPAISRPAGRTTWCAWCSWTCSASCTALYHGTKRSWGVVHNQAELYVRFGREIAALVREELAGCRYGQHAAGPSLVGGGGRG